jgi:glutathione S-transferase
MPYINNPKSPITPKLKGLHLFHFDGAPCAQRVRFVLGEKGLKRGPEVKFDADDETANKSQEGQWISRSVSLIKKENMTQRYAQIHPDMVVPALVHDGKLYLESMDIIEYLDQAFGGAPFIPTDPSIRGETIALVEQAKILHLSLRYVSFRWSLGRLAMLNSKENQKLQDLAAQGNDGENLVSFYDAYSNNKIPQKIFDEHLLKLYQAYQTLNTQLSDGRKFLMGDTLTIADVFWAMKTLRLIETGYRFNVLHPELYQWYERMYARPAFQNEVMAKNRMLNRVWRSKAAIERSFGFGLHHALTKLITV